MAKAKHAESWENLRRGGVNWWFAHHAGLKLEFLDQITRQSFSFLSTRTSQAIQLPEFRVGIAFR